MVSPSYGGMHPVNTDPAEADKFAAYGYLGAGTVVKVAYPAVTVSSNPLALTYWTSGGGYAGFDGLGRVIAQKWQIQSGGAVKDHFTYGYDANSNRLYRTNELSHTFDELYHANGATGAYDGLDRLKDFRRGTLTASNQILDTVATASRAQQWTLDAVGNWWGFKSTTQPSSWDHEQTRDHNKANEIADDGDTGTDAIEQVTGAKWLDPAYDLAGNMTKGPKPGDEATGASMQLYVYDAWSRLTKVYTDADEQGDMDSGELIVTYSYDGLNRRIRKVLAVPDPDVTYDYYYNESWQVLEVRKGGNANPYEQYVWGAQYIDAPVVRFQDTNTDGTLENTLYYMYDGNFNVTALIGMNGTVAERYVYDPYGKVSFLDGSWGALSASAYDNEILYCGYRFDPETGLYCVRHRYLHPTLGRWATRDPAGYVDGANLFGYGKGNPPNHVDPWGLKVTVKGDAGFAAVVKKAFEDICPCYRYKEPTPIGTDKDGRTLSAITIEEWPGTTVKGTKRMFPYNQKDADAKKTFCKCLAPDQKAINEMVKINSAFNSLSTQGKLDNWQKAAKMLQEIKGYRGKLFSCEVTRRLIQSEATYLIEQTSEGNHLDATGGHIKWNPNDPDPAFRPAEYIGLAHEMLHKNTGLGQAPGEYENTSYENAVRWEAGQTLRGTYNNAPIVQGETWPTGWKRPQAARPPDKSEKDLTVNDAGRLMRWLDSEWYYFYFADHCDCPELVPKAAK